MLQAQGQRPPGRRFGSGFAQNKRSVFGAGGHQERPNDLARAFNCSRCLGSLRAKRRASENRTQKIASMNPAIAEHPTINRRLGEDFLSGGIALSTSCTTEPWRASSIFAISNCLARSSKMVSLYFTSRSLRTDRKSTRLNSSHSSISYAV